MRRAVTSRCLIGLETTPAWFGGLKPQEVAESAIRGHESHRDAIRGHESHRNAIRGHESHRSAIKGHESHRSAIEGHESHRSAFLAVLEPSTTVENFRKLWSFTNSTKLKIVANFTL